MPNIWKNFYGYSGTGGVDGANEVANYAKQMGYYSIVVKDTYASLLNNYRTNQLFNGLYYIVNDPYYQKDCFKGVLGWETKNHRSFLRSAVATMPASDKAFYEGYMVWKSLTESFPDQINTGYRNNNNEIAVMWDFQQQRVIDYVVARSMEQFAAYDSGNNNFHFGGFVLDEPSLSGDFCVWNTSLNRLDYVNLQYMINGGTWNVNASSYLHSGITHEYSSYIEGRAQFMKTLISTMKATYPNAKFIGDPYDLYKVLPALNPAEYLWQIKDRADIAQLMPDMLLQERANTDFADSALPYTIPGFTKDISGIRQNSQVNEPENRLYAAKAAIQGSWYHFVRRLGGSGNMPNWMAITEIPASHKMIRIVPNWDNVNTIPLLSRSWNGSVYQSTNSYISSDIIYSRHWQTGKLFAVFLTTNGVINLNANEIVTSVQRTNGLFVESGDGSADVTISGTTIRINSGTNTNKGYIFIIATQVTNPPAATTSAATNIAIDSATLNATINANGLETTYYFRYGIDNQNLYEETAHEIITGTANNDIAVDITGLSASKTYYFRIVASNNAGTTSGSILSFTTTAETTKPSGSISINNGSIYTNSLNAVLNLSAIDNIGVIGYYISTSATVPGVGDPGWVAINSTLNYRDDVVYVLSSGEGTKTIYVWYKDAAGNISDTVSDTIIVDLTIPDIGITTPTPNPTITVALDIVALGGYTSDNLSGIGRVTWVNNRGGSGTAAGTTTWTISAILLQLGINEIIVTAEDNAGNLKTDTIVITYTPTQPVEDLEAVINIWNLKRKRVRIMEAVYNNIVIKQGSTFVQRFTLKQSTGLPVDLTGYQIRAQIRKTPLSRTKLFDFVATILDAANGDIQISLTAEQTAILPQGEAAYDVEIFTSGNIERVIEGSCIITSEVTR